MQSFSSTVRSREFNRVFPSTIFFDVNVRTMLSDLLYSNMNLLKKTVEDDTHLHRVCGCYNRLDVPERPERELNAGVTRSLSSTSWSRESITGLFSNHGTLFPCHVHTSSCTCHAHRDRVTSLFLHLPCTSRSWHVAIKSWRHLQWSDIWASDYSCSGLGFQGLFTYFLSFSGTATATATGRNRWQEQGHMFPQGLSRLCS